MSVYTINEATTVALGVSELRRTLVNQGVDTVEFTIAGAAVSDAPSYAYGAAITIQKDGANWFVGTIIGTPSSGSGSAQAAHYVVAGPWHDLERLVFQQTWKMWDTGTSALTNQYKSRVILGHSITGARLDVGEQIEEILTYAGLCSVDIDVAAISIPIEFPWNEAVDITCAEAIQTVLRWVPDAVTWFDYTTESPTFHVARRSALTSATVALSSCDTQNLDINPRNDLSVTAVLISYESNHHVDTGPSAGYDYQTITVDKYPLTATGRELGAIAVTMQLAGSSMSEQSQDIEVEALPTELNAGSLATVTNINWWKSKIPWLSNSNVSNVSIKGMERYGIVNDGTQYYANILTKGMIHDWMTDEAGEDSMEILISYDVARVTATGSEVETVINEPYIFKFIATSLDTGTYSRVASYSSGEAAPDGLAQALYTAANTLHYDGSLQIVASAPAGTVVPGKKLNISGGQSAWASMSAIVQQTTETITGSSVSTLVTIGPPKHLGPDDLKELMRASRSGTGATFWYARETGESYSPDTSITLNGYEPRQEVVRGAGESTAIVLYDQDTDSEIELDPALIDSESTIIVKPRKLTIFEPDPSGSPAVVTRHILASDSDGSVSPLSGAVQTIVTAVRYDTSTHQIQVKTRSVQIAAAGDESDWTMITGGQAAGCS